MEKDAQQALSAFPQTTALVTGFSEFLQLCLSSLFLPQSIVPVVIPS